MRESKLKPPSKVLFFIEGGRALYRLGQYYSKLPELRKLPKGNRQPVMVLPGYMAPEFTTRVLRSFLNDLGYQAFSWGLGLNRGRKEYEEQVAEKLEEAFEKFGTKITLIGWSLGGVYAREAARTFPEKVSQVITLGSPFNGIDRATNVSWIFEMLNGMKISDMDPELLERLKQPIPVPCTNIYSKTDGVVAWQGCIDDHEHDQCQNLEVNSSHTGLGHHHEVLKIIAEKLSNSWSDVPPEIPHLNGNSLSENGL